ncbi:DUF1269 domain-containing protein [Frankia sp. AgPm24]|uniref:DUF1269 domain-containing protein n=1 Tax=Frankia sp. AgPm24 TaxID=631128 RepID=UPI0020101A7F|nr:DUF1269 domain-containing protein [Frankia sp. AgPm24]MCK9924592.1 DUF1269 domain-containing protein [Frankia sp. AgPm24]
MTADSRLVVLGFDSLEQAREAWVLGRRLRRRRRLDVVDGALVWRDDAGQITIHRLASPPRTAALGGAACGGVLGTLFFAPLIGLGLGAGLGALISRVLGPGVDEAQIRRVAGHLQPGRAAVFALVRRSGEEAVDEVVAALRPHRPRVIMSTLPASRERHLAEALGRRAAPA